ncbi:1-deoxy-D-xylulose-5-phosphate reductoisomerase [Candidatus Pelagibacter sp.]|nr:1-deoxy-D-xylulose-5-phosphate reductoisomerase [Candidatus Pelagibacter sp.]
MRKKIVILGSTGSIGKNTLKIIKDNKKEFEIILLSTNKNINRIITQAKEFKVKNIIISDYKKYILAKEKFKKLDIKIFNKFNELDKILNKKNIYYSMVSISGLDGLKPTLQLTKYTKNLAVVNKESIICGWNLIQKALKKHDTNFIPIDSEHFSIFSLLQNQNSNKIDKVYITASGGPFLNFPKSKFDRIKPKDALKHPNWNMGKKITIDSATLMNKVFEVIEARNIFNITYDKISILTHPKSYVHAIIKFKNGLSKILIHEPDMKIPIYNSLYLKNNKTYKTNSLNLDILNNLNLKKVNSTQFPLVKLIDKLPKYPSLFETILITINDYLVYKFLNNKVHFRNLITLIIKISNLKEFQKYKKIKPKKVNDIYRLRDYVSSKMDSLGI